MGLFLLLTDLLERLQCCLVPVPGAGGAGESYEAGHDGGGVQDSPPAKIPA